MGVMMVLCRMDEIELNELDGREKEVVESANIV